MFWEPIANDACEVCQCSRLISNNFTLNSGGRSAGSRRSESRIRCTSRRRNLAPMSDYDKSMSPSSDKENMGSPLRNEDLSFYGGASPQASPLRPCQRSPCMDINMASPSKYKIVRQTNLMRSRQPLEDHDPNSLDSDSGYGASFDRETKSSFRFLEPSGLPPRRNIDPSPRKDSPKSKSHVNLKIYHSLSSGSGESTDDGFMEYFEMDSMDENAQLPSNLNSLISGDIKENKKTPEYIRPNFRRALSLNSDNHTPTGSKVRSCLFKPNTPELFTNVMHTDDDFDLLETARCFKRPEPPCDLASPVETKRRKSTSLHSISKSPIKKHEFLRSISENEMSIKMALARSTAEPDLIGDFSKSFCLPLIQGRHQDLKSISAHTLAKLLRGEFNDDVAAFKVIDCRYPYEYDGGHIAGAKNLYSKDQIVKELVSIKTDAPLVQPDGPKRHILVFHCEFSSERGPKLSRFLRNFDRDNNKEAYPALHYPEIYLLDGGYKDFYAAYADLCEPISYRPMLHPEYDSDLKHFRAKSKSWNGDLKGRLTRSRYRLN